MQTNRQFKRQLSLHCVTETGILGDIFELTCSWTSRTWPSNFALTL